MLLVLIAALMGYAHVSLVMKDLTVAAARKATARRLMGHVKVYFLYMYVLRKSLREENLANLLVLCGSQ